MCEFSHDNSKLETIKKENAILGSRFFKLILEPLTLKSLYQDYEFKTIKNKGPIPNMDGDLGFYSYNNYNNNYYNNYNYNYYNNNYYYNYNYNYYNNNYYYNYNNNYYYIGAITKSYGRVISHSLGYRSERIEIISFLSLKDHKNKEFLNHFNSQVEKIAKKFKISIQPYQFGDGCPFKDMMK